ncbi:tetratricopeptide repeat protein [Actinomadura sp. 1N219]|uniref:tetratricopeptide repeat protein n=1 Tax=Actinomadura sp. 1N219 TaxID=3375152 RepID=UPI00378DDAE5
MGTYSDLLKSRRTNRFAGRQEILSMFLRRLRNGAFEDVAILNIHGQTGMGKSFLLLQFATLAEAEGHPVAGISVQKHRTPFSALQSLYSQLRKSTPTSLLREFERHFEKLEAIEIKLAHAAGAMSAEAGESGGLLGGVVGETLGSATGLPMGSMVGSHIGSFIGGRISRSDVRRISRTTGLKEEDIQFCANAEAKLTELTVDVLNHLALEQGAFLLTVDVYEQCTAGLDEWLLQSVIPHLQTEVTLVVAGRIPLAELPSWEPLIFVTHPYELTSFTEAESIEFWRLHGIADEVKARLIHATTRGYPFLCGVIADTHRAKSDRLWTSDLSDLNDHPAVVERVISRFMSELGEDTLVQIIRACAVPRWFDREMVDALVGPDAREHFDVIVGLSFVLRNRDGSYGLHDLARAALLADTRALDPDRVRRMHGTVASLLRSRRSARGAQYLSDEIYHLLSADEEMGIELGHEMIRAARNIGYSTSLDPMIKEMAAFQYATRNGQLWKLLCTSQEAIRNGEWDTAERLLDDLDFHSDLPGDLKLWIIEMRAIVLVGRGSYQEALSLYQAAVDELETGAAAEPIAMTESYYRLVETCGILSRFSEADANIERGMRRIGRDPLSRARLLLAKATVCRLHGRTDEGIEAAKEAVGIYKTEDDPRSGAFAMIQLARLLSHSGTWVASEDLLREALTLEEQAPFEYDLGNIYLFRGNIERRRRNWKRALSLYERAISIHGKMGSWREIGPLYGSLGVVHHALGDRALAARYLEDSLRIKREQQYERGVAVTLKYMADTMLLEGSYDQALACCQEAIGIADHLDLRYVRSWARITRGRAQMRQGDFDAARATYVRS